MEKSDFPDFAWGCLLLCVADWPHSAEVGALAILVKSSLSYCDDSNSRKHGGCGEKSPEYNHKIRATSDVLAAHKIH